MAIEGYQDLKTGDIIESFEIETIAADPGRAADRRHRRPSRSAANESVVSPKQRDKP